MAITLQQLLTPSTEDESLETMLTILDSLGFSATSWQSGSLARTVVQMVAKMHADSTQTRVAMALGRFNDTATGGWLELLSASQFNNVKFPAITAQVNVLLSDPNSIGPYTITIGQLVAKDPRGNTYRNKAGGTLTAGGNLTLLFEAEVAGAASFPSSLELATPLAGIDADVVLPVIRLGVDAESDAKLRLRNQSKWATLALVGGPVGAYINWALTADPTVTRGYVDDLNPRGPGTVDLYVAGDSGSVPSGVVTAVYDYIQGNTDGVQRRPLSTNLEVFSAVNAPVSVAGTVYHKPGYVGSDIITRVQDAIDDMFAAVPLGGVAGGGRVTLSSIYAAAMTVQGVVYLDLSSPLANVTVGAAQVPVASFSLVAAVVT